LRRLRERGRFEIPEAVQSATDNFRENNDIVAVFIEECCETDPEASESGATLYAAYKEWCEESGHHPLGKVTVAEEWKRLGFHKYKSKGKARWRGVSVRMPG
jgi:putative DNA primase/helicase